MLSVRKSAPRSLCSFANSWYFLASRRWNASRARANELFINSPISVKGRVAIGGVVVVVVVTSGLLRLGVHTRCRLALDMGLRFQLVMIDTAERVSPARRV